VSGDSQPRCAAWPQTRTRASVPKHRTQTHATRSRELHLRRPNFPTRGQPPSLRAPPAPTAILPALLLTSPKTSRGGLGTFLTAFPFQTLIRITGKRTGVKTQAAPGRGVRPWRWQSGPSGQARPSAGTARSPSSEEPAGFHQEHSPRHPERTPSSARRWSRNGR